MTNLLPIHIYLLYVVRRIILIRFFIVLLYICAFFSEFLIPFLSINRSPSSGGKVIHSLCNTGTDWFPTFPSLAAQPLAHHLKRYKLWNTKNSKALVQKNCQKMTTMFSVSAHITKRIAAFNIFSRILTHLHFYEEFHQQIGNMSWMNRIYIQEPFT